MNDIATYREFKLRVPIWDISDDDGDSTNTESLFAILSVTPHHTSLAQLYDSFHDYSAARDDGDPYGRIGRGDLFIFTSDVDDDCFIAIDMFDEATDQMNTIEIAIRTPEDRANNIEQILQSIRSSAEVATALLQGDLGLKESLTIENFPRIIPNHDTEAVQQAQVYRGGCLIHTTEST
ncbi:MAG: hypothetical protein CMJ78_13790 [Planctomycetaceae bacterium]|nr:hypothetical protein [Planctomycetaceae bacterium]